MKQTIVVLCLLLTVQVTLAQAITLFTLVKEADLPSIRVAIARAVNIDITDDYGQTPLMYAAAINPDPAVISALIEAGADVNARTFAAWTALMYAVRDNPNPEVVQRLLDLGADPLLLNSNNQRAIDLAIENDAFYGSPFFDQLQALSVRSSVTVTTNPPGESGNSTADQTEACRPDRDELLAAIQQGVEARVAAEIANLDPSIKDLSWNYSNPQLAITADKARLTANWQASADVNGLSIGISGSFSANFAWEPCSWYLVDYALGN